MFGNILDLVVSIHTVIRCRLHRIFRGLEYMLEQSYIKELVSEEAEHTMRVLVANKQILDKETVICFTDFLDGYLRNGELRIPVPALAKEE